MEIIYIVQSFFIGLIFGICFTAFCIIATENNKGLTK